MPGGASRTLLALVAAVTLAAALLPGGITDPTSAQAGEANYTVATHADLQAALDDDNNKLVDGEEELSILIAPGSTINTGDDGELTYGLPNKLVLRGDDTVTLTGGDKKRILKVTEEGAIVDIAGDMTWTKGDAAFGGAIYFTKDNAEVTVSGAATFTGNTATLANGGAIFADSNGVVTVSGAATFTDNTAANPDANGGAIDSGNVTVSGAATFSGNKATVNGGAIRTRRGTPSVSAAAEFAGALARDVDDWSDPGGDKGTDDVHRKPHVRGIELDAPEEVNAGERDEGFSTRVTNAGTDLDDDTSASFVFSHDDAFAAEDVSVEYHRDDAWQKLDLEPQEGALTGALPLGLVPDGFDEATDLRVTFNKVGEATIDVALVDDGTVLAVDRRTVQVPDPSSNGGGSNGGGSDPSPAPDREPAPPPVPVEPPSPGAEPEPVEPLVPPGRQVTVPPGSGQTVVDGVAEDVEVSRPEDPSDVGSTAEFVNRFRESTGVGDRVRSHDDADGPSVTGLLRDPDDPERSARTPASAVTVVQAGSVGLMVATVSPSGAPRQPDRDGVPRASAGGRAGVAAGGLPADSAGQAQLRSAPWVLGEFDTDADGTLVAELLLPAEVPLGPHTLLLTAGSTTISVGIVVDERRIAGADRFATAALLSQVEFPDPAEVDEVLITAGRAPAGAGESPDALAAASLAGATGAPVLSVNNRAGVLPEVTAAELVRLDPDRVRVLGGPAAISDPLLAELDAAGGWQVERVAGADRYATAAQVAGLVPAAQGTVILASGESFADALAAGPLAAAGPHPILLTRRDALPEVTVEALSDADDVVIAGGPAVVSEDVFAEVTEIVGVELVRLAGADRVATATVIAEHLVAHVDGFDGDAAVLANGRGLADALSGGGFAGRNGQTVLLTDGTGELGATRAWLEANAATLTGTVALGGETVIPQTLLDEAVTAATG